MTIFTLPALSLLRGKQFRNPNLAKMALKQQQLIVLPCFIIIFEPQNIILILRVVFVQKYEYSLI